jgi:hypothetical protein
LGNRFVPIVGVAWVLFVCAVYLPDLGRGFVRDDFVWVSSGRAALDQPGRALLPDAPGFYRPLVTATFAADYAMHGLAARGYGFTNLALFVGCVAALWALCRQLRLSAFGATVAAFAWSVNPHGINMALVWLSGRTALCATLFALLAANAVIRRRHLWAGVFLACALASKEEAIVLPFVLGAWHHLFLEPERRSRHETLAAWASVAVPAIVYLIVRQATPAFTPASAPPFYQFTFKPGYVLTNAAAYLDRGATASAAIAILASISFWRFPSLTRDRARVMLAAAIWFVGAYAITVFLPVRSSLYAVLPSVGAAVAAAVLAESVRGFELTPSRRTVAFASALAGVLLMLIPIYSARNDRWVEPARLSHRALHVIGSDPRVVASRGVVVLHDVSDRMSSFASAFGTLATDALRLHTGSGATVWIEPPPPDWRIAGLVPPDRAEVLRTFALDRGRVFRMD